MVQNIQCPQCKKENIIKWTKRKTLNRGMIQRYKCKDCRRYFTLDNGFFRMRNSPQKITLCLDLFYKGISTRQVQSHLQAFYPHNSSHKSIYNWVVKYAKMIGKLSEQAKNLSKIQLKEKLVELKNKMPQLPLFQSQLDLVLKDIEIFDEKTLPLLIAPRIENIAKILEHELNLS